MTTPLRRYSLTAAAARLLSRRRTDTAVPLAAVPVGDTGWVDEAWDMYDQVGELRFVSNILATRMGQARLYIGQRQPGGTPEEVTDNAYANEILNSMGDALPGIITRLGNQLFVADGGYICAIPQEWIDNGDVTAPIYDFAVDDLRWAALSTTEVTVQRSEIATVQFEGVTFRNIPLDSLILVRGLAAPSAQLSRGRFAGPFVAAGAA